jgi:hypothetical protein
MLCAPAARLLVLHVAVLVLPAPESATAMHPAIDAPLSVNVTLPLGFEPVTVAVNVTGWPSVEGVSELVTVVVVAVVPEDET